VEAGARCTCVIIVVVARRQTICEVRSAIHRCKQHSHQQREQHPEPVNVVIIVVIAVDQCKRQSVIICVRISE
jgi:hypothetical protein